ncbi:MAG: hypothetical protein IPP90_04325 [Gemmatimonadaceae bacterium]|nr:hypothetical protein [Gemmatimonadaceae bacterium]
MPPHTKSPYHRAVATVQMFGRYAVGIRAFLRTTLSADACRDIVTTQQAHREESFLAMLEQGVYANPRSPYRQLLQHAGIQLPDATADVRNMGLETALTAWYDRGVYVTIDEFKGRKPIVRGNLTIDTCPEDFDNPLLVQHYETRTGGSRGPRTRLVVDLDLLTHEAAQTQLFLAAFGIEAMPVGIWREVLPGAVGIKTFLRHTKIGGRVLTWFTPRTPVARLEDLKYQAFTMATAAISRLAGRAMPMPRFVPPREAARIAQWLAEQKRQGTPAILDTNTSTAVRACLAAHELNLDIAGSVFRVSAEPYTAAKDAIIRERGCRTASHYSCAELGYIGLACANAESVDEVHLMTEKVALIQRPKTVGGGAVMVGALAFTTVLTSCPKLMVNVELGDYATITRRDCGCLLEQLGFTTHLHDVRSWEKLNSAGVTFLGTELMALVEEVLPAKFGGHAMDYQFVEEEEAGLPVVRLLVHPRLPDVDERAVVETVLRELRACPGGGLMSDTWRESGTLRVQRREPYLTGAFKLLPLHILGTTSAH